MSVAALAAALRVVERQLVWLPEGPRRRRLVVMAELLRVRLQRDLGRAWNDQDS